MVSYLVAVDTDIGWPINETMLKYERREFLLRPEGEFDYADCVTVLLERDNPVEVEEQTNRFLSALAWLHQGSIEIGVRRWSDEQIPARLPKPPQSKTGCFPAFKELADDSLLDLMLALYRQAMAVKSPLFSFFGFFKILNTKLTGDQQKDWIDENHSRVRSTSALARIAELQSNAVTVGTHIYHDIRTAIVHASENKNKDPDNPHDTASLQADLPVIKALAELFIEDHISGL